MENAPLLVKRCFSSIRRCMPEWEVRVITIDNIEDYISIPDYILKKVKRGIISQAHFSDLIRLELLIRYGGFWIDATVFCTGNLVPSYVEKSQLFLYQVLEPGRSGQSITVSNWLIFSKPQNNVLMLTRDFLYEYWKKYNYAVDYGIFHHFINIAFQYLPEEYEKIPKLPNSIPHILLLEMFDPFDEEEWKRLKSMSSFHKLTYKNASEKTEKKGTFYDVIINQDYEEKHYENNSNSTNETE